MRARYADEGAEVWRASLLSSVSAIGNPTGELLGALWLLLGAIIGNPSRVLQGVAWLLLRAVTRMSMSLLRGFSVNALQGLAGKTERADEGTEVWRASLQSSLTAVGNPLGVPSWLLLGATVVGICFASAALAEESAGEAAREGVRLGAMLGARRGAQGGRPSLAAGPPNNAFPDLA